MPKLRRGSARHSRHTSGKQQRSGAGWHPIVESTLPGDQAAESRTPSPPTVDEAAPAAEDQPAAPPARKPSKHDVSKRKRRDKQTKDAKRRKLIEDASNLSMNLGATAEGRHKVFARAKRSDECAARLAQYHAKQAASHLKKLIRKGWLAETRL